MLIKEEDRMPGHELVFDEFTTDPSTQSRMVMSNLSVMVSESDFRGGITD